ncbi:MAG: transposase [Candidatus Bathyarchaeia archaeon]
MMSLEVTQTVPFKYERSAEIDKLLSDYRDIVNACIKKLVELRTTSLKSIHEAMYEELKGRYPYQTSFYVTAYRVAISVVKAWRKRGGEVPEIKKLFVKVSPLAYKFDGETIRISVKPRNFVRLRLIYGSYQRKFVEAWKRGELKIGEIIINEQYVLIPFKRIVNLLEPKGAIALDINEENITALATDGGSFIINTSEIKRIRSAYFEKRRRIQMKVAKGTKAYKKLMEKYGKRERNKIKDVLHKLSKIIVEKCRGYTIVFEDLKGLRKSTNKKVKKYNRFSRRVQECSVHSKCFKRVWNAMPVRKLQFYIEYKHLLNGYTTSYVDRRNTSKICSVCGSIIEPKEQKCPKCGIDRHLNACRNLLIRSLQDVRSFRLPRKPHDEWMKPVLTSSAMRTSGWIGVGKSNYSTACHRILEYPK